MKWYWVVVIAVVVFIIAYWVGKQQALGKAIVQEKDVNTQLESVLNQLNNSTGRETAENRNRLIAERDRLLRIKNPTRLSTNYIVNLNGESPNAPYWNGWIKFKDAPSSVRRNCPTTGQSCPTGSVPYNFGTGGNVSCACLIPASD